MTELEFLEGALANGMNGKLLAGLRLLALPGCYLTAGCLFQPIWNRKSGRPADCGVKDYDVIYFDDDLSWEGEDEVIRRVAEHTAGLPAAVEVRNQARVHLWYPERFGAEYPRLTSARDGIDRYLICCTCVGVEVESGAVYAPHGFDELTRGDLRINPLNSNPDRFRQKARSYQSRWPWLTIVE
jgi:hypothetical protein